MIDFHSHLSFFETKEATQIVKNLRERDIYVSIMGGYDPEDWQRQIEIKEKCKTGVEVCVGLHPWYVSSCDDSSLSDALKTLNNLMPKASFLGELGLDFSQKKIQTSEIKKKQIYCFKSQLDINLNYRYPLVIHAVNSHVEVLSELKNYNFKGIVHSFGGTYEEAKGYIDLGFFISISPRLMNSSKLKDIIKKIELEHIVVETDQPSKKGIEYNYDTLKFVVEYVAEIKNITALEVIQGLGDKLRSLVG